MFLSEGKIYVLHSAKGVYSSLGFGWFGWLLSFLQLGLSLNLLHVYPERACGCCLFLIFFFRFDLI